MQACEAAALNEETEGSDETTAGEVFRPRRRGAITEASLGIQERSTRARCSNGVARGRRRVDWRPGCLAISIAAEEMKDRGRRMGRRKYKYAGQPG